MTKIILAYVGEVNGVKAYSPVDAELHNLKNKEAVSNKGSTLKKKPIESILAGQQMFNKLFLSV